jgi:hypothetical protein
MMKVGILEFRYGHSANFAKRLRKNGSYTINLGDWIQSLAVQRLVESLGQSTADILRVDRDSLPTYQGPPLRLIMNACFLEHCFPLPPAIEPIFIGFQTSSRELIHTYLEFFKQHQPIGCRDTSTRDFFREQGVDAYITGCLTMTLPLRDAQPKQPMTLFIGGEGPGEMPSSLKKYTPPDIRKSSGYQHQREAVKSFPLSDADALTAQRLAKELLETYRTQATRVVSPLLHAAGPSLAMGIPVILARKDLRDRFSAINRLLPLYTPQDFPVIDWNPPPLHLEELKECLSTLVARALAGAGGPTAEERQTLASFYDRQPYFTQDLIAARIEREARPFWKKLFS